MPALVASTVPVGSLAAQSQPTLTAGGVLLRPWTPGDAQAVMDAYQDEEIQRWHVQRADSLAEARQRDCGLARRLGSRDGCALGRGRLP